MNKLRLFFFSFSVCISGYAQSGPLLLRGPYNVGLNKFENAGKKEINLLAPTIPIDYHTKKFGFFCRQVLKLQNAHVPFIFRVGTVDQCNYLEQKNAHH